MIKRTYTYNDFDGNERTEDCYFHLFDAEIVKLELGTTGGLSEKIKRIISSRDIPEIIKVFDEIIDLSYGVKSPDGRQFIKNIAQTEAFKQTECYNKLYMDFITKEGFAAEFFNELISQGMSKEIMDQINKENNIVQMPNT